MLYGLRPGPCPGWTGTRPRRSGRPKFETPFPPNFVPKMENKTVYCEIGSNRPSQSAQPLGAKLPQNILTSPRNGCTMGAPFASRLVLQGPKIYTARANAS